MEVTMPGRTPSQALSVGRETIRRLAALHRTVNPRVFGSVLTGEDREDSDLDVLVEPLPETTLFDLGGLQDELEEALGVRVDVKTPLDLPPRIREDVLRQAVPI
jgi:predicted nucleotidyltransferase